MQLASNITPSKHKGRPRTFDREAALHRALGIFWRRGYEPTSIAELCTVMGINPPSLYAAFGNKAKLFMEAVTHYETTYWDATWEQMVETPDIHQAMHEFFHKSAHILTSQDAPCGCLVILAATNVSAEADEVNTALCALRKEGKELFISRVERGRQDGQLPDDLDTIGAALALNILLEGMSLAVRDGATREELERVADAAMFLLPRRS